MRRAKPKALKRGQHPCETCGKPTSLRGWYFVTPSGKNWSLRSGKKEYHWWCEAHFRTRMFNDVPFTCSERCQKATCKKVDIQFRGPKDHYVWLNLVMAYETDHSVPGVKIGTGTSFALKPGRLRCPWCGKRMRLATSAYAAKGQKRGRAW